MPTDWTHFLESWLNRGWRNPPNPTQLFQRRILNDFALFTRKSWDLVTSDDVRLYRLHLEAEQYALSSIRWFLVSLRAFFHQAQQQGLLAQNPVTLDCLPPSQVYTSLRFLSADEEQCLLAAIDLDSPWGVRDYALILFLLRSGRRASEVLHLRWGDFEVTGDQVWYSWLKKSHHRHPHLPPAPPRPSTDQRFKSRLDPEVWQAILRFLRRTHRLPSIRPAHILFAPLSDLTGIVRRQRGKGWRHVTLDPKHVNYLIKSYASWAGLPYHEISPKALRYTALFHQVQQGLSLQELSEFFGVSCPYRLSKVIRTMQSSLPPVIPPSP